MSGSRRNSDESGQAQDPIEIPPVETGELTLHDVVPKHDKMWWHYPYLLKLNTLLLSGILANVVAGYDGSMVNGLQSLDSWQEYFDHPTGERLGTMSMGITIGSLCTTPFVWYFTERLGRKPTLIIGCIISILGGILQGCSANYGMFVASRIILGVGGLFCAAVAPVFLTECAYPTQRPSVTSMFLVSWPFGAFIAAVVTWGPYNSDLKYNNWSWRIPSLLQSFFPVIQLVLAVLGPESPRWLISKGKLDKALDFFSKYHGDGDPSSALVQFQMAEISATIEAEKLQKQSRWTEYFKSKAMLHRLAITLGLPVMQQLCGNAVISYYLHIILDNLGITNALDQLKINIGMTVFGLFFAIFFGSLIYRFPRRLLLMAGYLSMCLTYTIFTIVSALNQKRNFEDGSLAVGAVVMIFAFQAAYHIASPVPAPYIMEINPFSLRAKAGMLYGLAGGVVGIFNAYVNPIAMEKISWKYYIVWDIWLVVQTVIVYFCFPETHGLALEEVAQVFGDALITPEKTADQLRTLNTYGAKEDFIEQIEDVDARTR